VHQQRQLLAEGPAEGEELGSNILRVIRRSPSNLIAELIAIFVSNLYGRTYFAGISRQAGSIQPP
jgi:hypothetical protein